MPARTPLWSERAPVSTGDPVETVVEAAAVQVQTPRHGLDVAREVEERLQRLQQHRRRRARLVQRTEDLLGGPGGGEQGAVGTERRPPGRAREGRVERGQFRCGEGLPARLPRRPEAERHRIARPSVKPPPTHGATARSIAAYMESAPCWWTTTSAYDVDAQDPM